jgi:hypothetical protein
MTMTTWTTPQRWVAGGIGLIAGVSLITQTTLTVIAMMYDGKSLGTALIQVTGYFTLWTNALVAVVCGLIVVGRLNQSSKQGRLLVGGTAYAIAMVGIVYQTLLASQWNPTGLWFFSDLGVHAVTPIAMTLFWLWAGATGQATWRDGLLWLVWPSFYVVHAMIRGVITGWFPYFFLDATEQGWPRTFVVVGVLLIVFAVAAQVYVALGRLRPARLATSG